MDTKLKCVSWTHTDIYSVLEFHILVGFCVASTAYEAYVMRRIVKITLFPGFVKSVYFYKVMSI